MLTHTIPARGTTASTEYPFGYAGAEHERLIRQAAIVAPITERLFREAGIGSGHRVLDLGSGLGDVSMIAARLVGPTGEVVGVERDAGSILRAGARVAAAGLGNVRFVRTELHADLELDAEAPFDAVVGRFILQFLPDPAAVLRAAVRLLVPGGVVALQEPYHVLMGALGTRRPLWTQVRDAVHEALRRGGADPALGLVLHRVMRDAGLPMPALHLDVPLSADPRDTALTCDVVRSLQPMAERLGVSFAALGDLDTLIERVRDEAAAADAVVPRTVPVVSAWTRRPA
jgi:ubiquinone/menaquinone biosynthesis C-methylase UbiE